MAARNQGIDALRGISIVLVILHHLAIRLPLSHTAAALVMPKRIIDALCWNGGESVTVFFVISGFLIAGNALERWGGLDRPQFRAFYVRRGARILPCLVGLVVVLSVLDLSGVPNFVISRPDQSLPGAVFAALTFHINWYEAYSGYLPANWDVLWSLAVEEVFYLAFPILCLLAGRGQMMLAVPLMALALSLPVTHGAIHGNELLREKAYLPGMAAIATGVLAAMAVHGRTLHRRVCGVLVAIGCCAWIAVMVGEDLIWPYFGEATMLILTIGTGLLLAGLRGASPVLKLTGWLRSFGRLSYEAYLTHMFAVFACFAAFRAAALPDRLGYLLYPCVLAVAWLLATVVANAVSQPAERWLRDRLLPDAGAIRRESFRRSRSGLFRWGW